MTLWTAPAICSGTEIVLAAVAMEHQVPSNQRENTVIQYETLCAHYIIQ